MIEKLFLLRLLLITTIHPDYRKRIFDQTSNIFIFSDAGNNTDQRKTAMYDIVVAKQLSLIGT